MKRLRRDSIASGDALPGGIFACEKAPLVYYNMPKCACTTIKNVMHQIDHGEAFAQPLDIHRPIATGKLLISRHQPEQLRAAITGRKISFTFVRHPLKRAYSCFNEKLYHQSAHSFRGLRNGVLRKQWDIRFPAEGEDYSVQAHADNFARFLRFVEANIEGDTKVRQDPHWLPQSLLLRRMRERGEVDLVGRLERYRDDLDYVLRTAGIEDREPLLALRFNEGLPPPFPYEDVLTDEVLERGLRVFAPDFERFAYPLPTA